MIQCENDIKSLNEKLTKTREDEKKKKEELKVKFLDKLLFFKQKDN